MKTKNSKKAKKLILVTGGAGYIGSLLAHRLLAAGYGVRVFDKMVYGDFALTDIKKEIEIVKGDVKNPPASIMKGVYGVVHLAGLSTEPTAYYSPRNADLTNHIGTEKLAVLAKKAGVERFIFGSTASIYFTYDTPVKPPQYKETEALNPISPYSLSKRAAEEALFELADKKFQPTVFRKGTIYGFTDKMRYDLVVNSFTKDAFTKKKITVHAGGNIYRPMLDVQDAVAAYQAALELPIKAVGGRIFNVSHGNWQIADLGAEVVNIIKKKKGVEVVMDVLPVGVARNYLMDTKLFRQTFGLKQSRPLTAAVMEIWEKLEAGHDHADKRYYTDLWHKKFA